MHKAGTLAFSKVLNGMKPPPVSFGSGSPCVFAILKLLSRPITLVNPVRISIVEYLNTAPLVWGFTEGPLQVFDYGDAQPGQVPSPSESTSI